MSSQKVGLSLVQFHALYGAFLFLVFALLVNYWTIYENYRLPFRIIYSSFL